MSKNLTLKVLSLNKEKKEKRKSRQRKKVIQFRI